MTIRYAGASEVRSVSIHEEKREPDGASAIDPDRSHLNRLLWSDSMPEPQPSGMFPNATIADNRPRTQQEALESLWASGVQRPAKQAEAPYVQMVLSASPEYFRDPDQGPGEWNKEKLDRWVKKTMKWLRDEYGPDLAHVSLHLDEDTPHMHILIVPTYQKRPRKPGRRKRGETPEEFEARKQAVENAPTVRVAGRASNEYWKRAWARREARLSYHQAVADLGLGYGRDFVGEGEPSPEHVKTGTWVREKSRELEDTERELDALAAAVKRDAEHEARARAEAEALRAEAARDRAEAKAFRAAAKRDAAEAAQKRAEASRDRSEAAKVKAEAVAELEQARTLRDKALKLGRRVFEIVEAVAERLGVGPKLSEIKSAIAELETKEQVGGFLAAAIRDEFAGQATRPDDPFESEPEPETGSDDEPSMGF
ncbi:plasmid recombination protein [Thioclava sp. L04-15]|uniref:plasmid recombination protein n=1 Tax=Thioclava sp. L04-15 TaxID=1915318 RepID=UPI001438785B|nr:plasmid recombination protein [Thioclava sp. L04-15]